MRGDSRVREFDQVPENTLDTSSDTFNYTVNNNNNTETSFQTFLLDLVLFIITKLQQQPLYYVFNNIIRVIIIADFDYNIAIAS